MKDDTIPNYKKKKVGKKYINQKKEKYTTFEGKSLTPLEAKFIDLYIETGNVRQSVIQAGYKTNDPSFYGNELMHRLKIQNEITHRLQILEDAKVATGKEVLEYLTSVMRGEEKDQFGLDAPLSERTKAAMELAKRTIDIAQKIEYHSGANKPEIKITLDWGGFDEE